MGLQDQRFAAKEIRAPQTVLRVSEEREPGRATGARLRPVVLGEHAAHDVLVDVDAEDQGNLLGDPPAAEAWVSLFYLDNGAAQLRRGPLRAWLSPAVGRKQLAVLASYECPVEI